MKRHTDSDGLPHGGPASVASIEDLAFAVDRLAESEKARSEAVAALARVRARGDGEAAVGMPVEQYLRYRTSLRRGTVTTMSIITDVAGDLPCMIVALESGAITLDQAGAIAWPAARVRADIRRTLNEALCADPDWVRWSCDQLEFEITRIIEELTPRATQAAELRRAEAQFFNRQSTLDGQGLKFNGEAFGVDAAFINATLDAACAAPAADTPDPDGILVGQPTKRSGQLFDGLMQIFRGWASGGVRPGEVTAPDVTIFAIVDERDETVSEAGVHGAAGEILTKVRGLAPRLTAKTVQRLVADGARRVEVYAVDAEIVAVKGRAGHAIHDPDGLSEDTTRIICTIRDRTCRMPGCDRPVLTTDLHHLVWKALARARGETAPDDPGHRASLCRQCHRLVHHHHWTGTVGRAGQMTWHQAPGRAPPITTTTVGRLARRLRPPPRAPDLDADGDPLPF